MRLLRPCHRRPEVMSSVRILVRNYCIHSNVMILILIIVGHLLFVQSFAVVNTHTKLAPTTKTKTTMSSSVRTTRKKDETTALLGSPSSSSGIMDGGTIKVKVSKEVFPTASVDHSRCVDAWMEHHWKRGGGLPIFVVVTTIEDERGRPIQVPDVCLDDADGIQHVASRRTIYPIGMAETITSIRYQKNQQTKDSDHYRSQQSNTTMIIEYNVTKSGPFFSDMVPFSHEGRVSFVETFRFPSLEEKDDEVFVEKEAKTSPAIMMVWEVEFEVSKLRWLYQLVADFAINVAARTVQESLQPVRVLNIEARIPCRRSLKLTRKQENNDPSDGDEMSQLAQLERELLGFFWSFQGGGLPLPPPIPFGERIDLSTRVGSDNNVQIQRKLLRIPPIIVETILSTTDWDKYVFSPSDEKLPQQDDKSMIPKAEIVYRLENAGWLTFPFLIHTHIGRIQLSSSSSSSDTDDIAKKKNAGALLQWQVEIRPFRFLFVPRVVEMLTEMTVTTIVRNFISHMDDRPSLDEMDTSTMDDEVLKFWWSTKS